MKLSSVLGASCAAAIVVTAGSVMADDSPPPHPWAAVGDAIALEGAGAAAVGVFLVGAAADFCINAPLSDTSCPPTNMGLTAGGGAAVAMGGGVAFALGLPLALARTKTLPAVVAGLVGVPMVVGSLLLVPTVNLGSKQRPMFEMEEFAAVLPLGVGFTTTAIGLAASKGDGKGGLLAGGAAFVVGGAIAALAVAIVAPSLPQCPAYPSGPSNADCFEPHNVDELVGITAASATTATAVGTTMLIGAVTHARLPVAVVPFAQGAAIVGTF
jgi:hypothetical protein